MTCCVAFARAQGGNYSVSVRLRNVIMPIIFMDLWRFVMSASSCKCALFIYMYICDGVCNFISTMNTYIEYNSRGCTAGQICGFCHSLWMGSATG